MRARVLAHNRITDAPTEHVESEDCWCEPRAICAEKRRFAPQRCDLDENHVGRHEAEGENGRVNW